MKKTVLILMVVFSVVGIITCPSADDSSLFVASVSPDALIILDMSGSMVWDPAGNMGIVYPNRRIDIARKVLKDLLDDNDDNNITDADEENLNVRMGYMRFWNSMNNDDNNPKSGNIIVRSDIGEDYDDIWRMIIEAGWDEQSAYTPVGGTPLAASCVEAKKYYLETVNPNDKALECRKKFVILITDGADTWGCNGNGNTTTPQMRMLTVQRVKELRDAGIDVFVVGFGSSMPVEQLRTLNWAAKYGNTSDPDGTFTGDPEAYRIENYLPSGSNPDACLSTADPVALDPGTYELSGYAFLAADAAALSKSLKNIFAFIAKKQYSYTSPTVPAVRISESSTVYISSFKPNETANWEGTLKAYALNSNGTLPVDANGLPANAPLWDAGEKLKGVTADSRKIYVDLDGSSTPTLFTKANVTPSALGLSSNSERDKLVDHIRGIDAYDINNNKNYTEQKLYKLGDIFHSNAVIVGEPSRYFEDKGYSGSGGFYTTYKNRRKVIIAGANDGMLHAFDAATGSEVWAFIPNAVLTDLRDMRYDHTFYVDASPKVADVWFYSSDTDTTKSVSEWKTVLICGLRKGGNKYFALDITDTENPKVLWTFPSSANLYKVGESWSEPVVGRVKIEVGGELYERWVAFVGGGYLQGEHQHHDPDGRSFFVIDVKTGAILWEYYYKDNVSEKEMMRWGLPASPTLLDMDKDGFIDKVYIGDLGGNMWVFNVSADDKTKKSNSLWSGRRLYDGTSNHPIYYQPAVTLDKTGTPWVYWGTGDREDPTNKNSYDRFYGVKDGQEDGTGYPYTESNLTDVTTTNTFDPDPLNKGAANKGWYIRLEKMEKVLARPAAFSGIVYFTTFTPGDQKECRVAGTARLYFVEFRSGGGATTFSSGAYLSNTTSARYKEIGDGLASAPVISVDSKGRATVMVGTTGSQVFSQQIYSQSGGKQLLYWREHTGATP